MKRRQDTRGGKRLAHGVRCRRLGRCPWLPWGLGAFFISLVVVPLGIGTVAIAAGETAARGGLQDLVDGDLREAEASLSVAAERFDRAHRWLTSPRAVVPRVFPVARANTAAAAEIARAGRLLAEAGEQMAASGADLDPARLVSPHDGALPVEALREFAPLAAAIAAKVTEAADALHAIEAELLLPPVANARRALLAEVDDIAIAATGAGALAESLPSFLGAEGPRRYFFGAASPSEARGSGGFIGAYTIVEVRSGRLTFGDFQPVQSLEDLPPYVLPPADPSLSARYDQYGGTGFWLNINMTPDFPSTGHAITQLYERATGVDVDGVIITTPAALARLMALTGPVEIAGYGTLLPEDAVEVLGNEAYGDIEDPAERKRLLGAAAKDVLERFLGGSSDPLASARTLASIAAAGDLLLYSEDAEEQAALQQAGIAGALDAAESDGMVAVIGNNAAGNKVDYYMDRLVEHQVNLEGSGTATARTEVLLRNNAPSSGLPEYILGPFPGTGLQPGDNVTILSTYCSVGCRLTAATRNGAALSVQPEVELGYPVFTNVVELSSGESTTLAYGWEQAGAWQGDDRSGTYTFRFLDQPTIRPTQLEVRIDVPAGMEIVRASAGVTVDGDRVIWHGEPAARQDITVEWRRPLGQSLTRPLRELFVERVAAER